MVQAQRTGLHLQCRTSKFGGGYEIVQDSAEATTRVVITKLFRTPVSPKLEDTVGLEHIVMDDKRDRYGAGHKYLVSDSDQFPVDLRIA